METGVLRALRDIEPGDELRYFYPSTEWSMAETFHCLCGSAECLGSITGAAGMPVQALLRHRLSPWIRECLTERVPVQLVI